MKLETPTNRTKDGPIVRHKGTNLEIEYDYEEDSGEQRWSVLSFSEVLAFEFRQEATLDGDDVVPAREIAELEASPLLEQVMTRWQRTVGSQQWHQSRGGSGRYKHFKVFFDDVGCFDVVSASCSVARKDQMDQEHGVRGPR